LRTKREKESPDNCPGFRPSLQVRGRMDMPANTQPEKLLWVPFDLDGRLRRQICHQFTEVDIHIDDGILAVYPDIDRVAFILIASFEFPEFVFQLFTEFLDPFFRCQAEFVETIRIHSVPAIVFEGEELVVELVAEIELKPIFFAFEVEEVEPFIGSVDPDRFAYGHFYVVPLAALNIFIR